MLTNNIIDDDAARVRQMVLGVLSTAANSVGALSTGLIISFVYDWRLTLVVVSYHMAPLRLERLV